MQAVVEEEAAIGRDFTVQKVLCCTTPTDKEKTVLTLYGALPIVWTYLTNYST